MSFSRPVFVVIIAIAFPPRSDKTALVPLLLLALLVLLVLANSAAEYVGVRHALTVYVVLAVLSAFAVRRLLSLRQQVLGIGVLTVTALACTPALAVERPWEYHNAIGEGTRNAYRYFRNGGVDLGQRDREIAEYCHRHLERFGEVPYVVYEPSLLQADLVRYLRLRLKVLDDPSAEESIRLPRREHFWYWQERCLLRSGPTLKLCEMPNPSIAEETCSSTRVHTLPNVRADALIDRAEKLLEAPTLDSPQKIESWLKESLTLRPDDFGSWMMLGNPYLRQSQRERALAAYRRAANATPSSPVRRAIEEQIVLVSTHPINTVAPLRDPTME